MDDDVMQVPHPTPGCEGFSPASGGWIRCRCWQIGFDANNDLDIIYQGPVDAIDADAVATRISRELVERHARFPK